jgi:hypothetical protein
MKAADIDIEDFFLNRPETKGNVVDGEIRTVRKIYDENHVKAGNTSFLMEEDESYGTNRLFALSAPIIDALERGRYFGLMK